MCGASLIPRASGTSNLKINYNSKKMYIEICKDHLLYFNIGLDGAFVLFPVQ